MDAQGEIQGKFIALQDGVVLDCTINEPTDDKWVVMDNGVAKMRIPSKICTPSCKLAYHFSKSCCLHDRKCQFAKDKFKTSLITLPTYHRKLLNSEVRQKISEYKMAVRLYRLSGYRRDLAMSIKKTIKESVYFDIVESWIFSRISHEVFDPDVLEGVSSMRSFYFNTMQAESDDSTQVDFGIVSYIAEVARGVYSNLKGVVTSLAEIIRLAIEKVFDCFGSIFSVVGVCFEQISKKLRNHVARAVVDCFSSSFKEKVPDPEISAKIVTFVVIFSVIGFCVAGIITSATCYGIFRFLTGNQLEEFQAESASAPAVAIGLCASIFGRTPHSFSIGQHLKRILLLISVSGAITTLASGLFVLLPLSVRLWFKSKFAPDQYLSDVVLQDWKNQAMALYSVSRVPSVITSESYYNRVNQCVKSGIKLFKQLTNAEDKQVFVNIYSRLLTTLSCILQFRHTSPNKAVPFAFHIYGKPGAGKSTMLSRLMYDAFGKSPSNTYYRPLQSEYWNGFSGQTSIVYDEWMMGDPQRKRDLGLEFLNLISPSQFQPDMASVDNPNVGVKGTTAEPDVVVTVNNERFTRVEGVNTEALIRRYWGFIEVCVKPEYRLTGTRNVDMASMTNEQIANFEWIYFRIHPPLYTVDGEYTRKFAEDNKIQPTMDYKSLVTILKNSYQTHVRIMQAVRQHASGCTNVDTPDSIIESILAEYEGIPIAPMSFKDVFLKFLKDTTGVLHPEPVIEEDSEEDGEDPDPLAWQTTDLQFGSINMSNLQSDFVAEGRTKASKRPIIAKTDVLNNSFIRREDTHYRRTSQIAGRDLCGDPMYEHLSDIRDNIMPEEDYDTASDASIIERAELAHEMAEDYEDRSLQSIEDDRNEALAGNEDVGLINMRYDEQYRRVRLEHQLVNYVLGIPVEFNYNVIIFGMSHRLIESCTRGAGSGFVLMSGVLLLYGAFRMLKWLLTNGAEDQGVSFVAESGKNRKNKDEVARAKKAGKFHSRNDGFKNGIHDDADLIIGSEGVFQSESREPVVMKIEVGSHRAIGIGLKKNYFLTMEHAFRHHGQAIGAGEIIKLERDGKTYSAVFKPALLYTNSDCDLAIYEFEDKFMPSFPDITKRFISEHQISECNHMRIKLESPRKEIYAFAQRREVVSYSIADRNRTLHDCFAYQALTEPGDCGSIVQVWQGDLMGKILGIHVAGSSRKDEKATGICSIITREMIDNVFQPVRVDELVLENLKSEGDEYLDETEFIENMRKLPNTSSIQSIARSSQVFLPEKTKYQQTMLNENGLLDNLDEHDWDLHKVRHMGPAILSRFDERSGGTCPVRKAIANTLSVDHHTVIDPYLVSQVFQDIKADVIRSGVMDVLPRKLTFDEAVGGVPGILASINVGTSPGHPLVRAAKKKGKRDFFHYNSLGELVIEDGFRSLYQQFETSVLEGQMSDTIWLGYLKDEIVSEKKIGECRTRVVYASNLLCSVLYRKYFGGLLAGFNSSTYLPVCIGLNPYSHDMQIIYDYLVSDFSPDAFIAGDYRQFDMRVHPAFQEGAYRVLTELGKLFGVPSSICAHFVHNETMRPGQMGSFRFQPHTNHMSGCTFTTIVNCLVNEGYMRYSFAKICPELEYSRHVKAVYHGDDHVLALSRDMVEATSIFSPEPNLSKLTCQLHDLGQIYTSAADKSLQPLPVELFSRVTFLGCTPRIVLGKFVGVADLSSILKPLLWETDKGAGMYERMETALNLVTAHGREKFFELETSLFKCLNGFPMPRVRYWEGLRSLCNRTAKSGYTFYAMGFQAEGDDRKENKSGTGRGLTTFQTTGAVASVKLPNYPDKTKCINERDVTMTWGADGFVYRGEFTWTTTQVIGNDVFKIRTPYEILKTGNTNNLQNMPFERTIYWRGSTTLRFQVNGTPFFQGVLVAYFYPFMDGSNIAIDKCVSTDHVLLAPNINSTADLTVPFRYPRHVLNSYAGLDLDQISENLGTFSVRVLSPLRSAAAADTVTVSWYSRFSENEFVIPRPIKAQEVISPKPTIKVRSQFVKGIRNDANLEKAKKKVDFQSEGNVSSNVNNYKFGDISGTGPVIGGNKTAQTPTNTVSPQTKMDMPVPMDNPPLASGSMPIHQHFSGLSKSNGVEPTTALSLHPGALDFHHKPLFIAEETTVNYLLTRRSFLGSFEWKKTDAANTNLWTTELHSMFDIADGDEVPVSIAVLNQFQFWHADIVLELVCVRTNFHSGRLRVSVAYGAPTIEAANQTVYYTEVVDFNDQTSSVTMTIPWNQQTEYLHTFSGDMPSPIQNMSLGHLGVFVANDLRAPETVAEDVEVLVFMTFKNIRTAVPRPQPLVSYPGTSVRFNDVNFYTLLEGSTVQGTANVQEKYVAEGDELVPFTGQSQGPIALPASSGSNWPLGANGAGRELVRVEEAGPSTITVPTAPAIDDKPENIDSAITEEMKEDLQDLPCAVRPDEKFPYAVTDIHEFARRSIKIPLEVAATENQETLEVVRGETLVVTSQYTVFKIPVFPKGIWGAFYAGWAGSLKYRFFINNRADLGEVDFTSIYFVPCHVDVTTFVDSIMGHLDSAGPLLKNKNNVGVTSSTDFTSGGGQVVASLGTTSWPKAAEQAYPLGTQSYIDVLVPFQTIFNYMQMVPTVPIVDPAEFDEIATGFAIGYIVVVLPTKVGTGSTPPTSTVYQCVGDNFTYGIFRPPYSLVRKDPILALPNGGATINVGGYFKTETPPSP